MNREGAFMKILKKFAIWSIAFFLAINLIWITVVVSIGNAHKLPEFYKRMSLAIYQGFNCGWTEGVDDIHTCELRP